MAEERFVEVHYNPREGFTLRVRPMDVKLLPEPTRQHLRTSSREFLLALRSLLDQAIARTEEKEPSQRVRRVKVEGDTPPGSAS